MLHRGKSAIALFAVGLIVASGAAQAVAGTEAAGDARSTGAIRVRADIDGLTHLCVRGHTLHWHHLRWAAPGRDGGGELPTYVNGRLWYPRWPQPGRNDDVPCSSSIYREVAPPLPAEAVDMALMAHRARCNVRIVQWPYVQNDYTLVVAFDDRASGGSEWYEATVAWPADKVSQRLATSSTVELHVRLIDVAMREDGPRGLDLSPEALGLDSGPDAGSPDDPPVKNILFTVARVESLESILTALNRQGAATVRAEQRFFADPGGASAVEVKGRRRGETNTSLRVAVKEIDRAESLVHVGASAFLSVVARDNEGEDMLDWSSPWGFAARPSASMDVAIPSGYTAFLPLKRPPNPAATNTVALVTAVWLGRGP